MQHKPIKHLVCVAEDRKSCEPAVKLLLTSLHQYSTDIPVVLFYPPADQDFLDWVNNLNFEKLLVRTTPVPGAYGWNVKPQALLEMLREGNQEVIWIDSDILTTKSIASAIEGLDADLLLLTEEALLGQNETDGLRARLWGLSVKRKFPFPLNTAVMRVTQHHVSLLKRWKEALESTKYRQAQQQPMDKRPLHMFGDQDALTALLSSDEFHNCPVKILRRGRDIIQFYEWLGFTFAERVTCMVWGMPIFIHQQGWKPWLASPNEKLKGLRGKIVSAYQDLSPHTVAALAVEPALNETWARPRSKLSSALRKLSFGYPPLAGLPIAIIFDLERLGKLPRTVVKNFLARFYPEALFTYRARRVAKEMRSHFHNEFLARQIRMKARIYDASNPYVLSGPFAGMKYLNEIVWGPIEPKWVGTYEQELHQIMQRILQTKYLNIIDVGSAEGYYAVGLAIKFPMARVYSYDVDPWARSQQRRLARLNHANNIEIHRRCTSKELTNHIVGRTLLICDIEGNEYDLLDPYKTPDLRKCDILVEMHEYLESGFSPQTGADELVRRFSKSHAITKIGVAPRSSTDINATLRAKLTAQELADSMDERRSQDQIWLWLEVRA